MCDFLTKQPDDVVWALVAFVPRKPYWLFGESDQLVPSAVARFGRSRGRWVLNRRPPPPPPTPPPQSPLRHRRSHGQPRRLPLQGGRYPPADGRNWFRLLISWPYAVASCCLVIPPPTCSMASRRLHSRGRAAPAPDVCGKPTTGSPRPASTPSECDRFREAAGSPATRATSLHRIGSRKISVQSDASRLPATKSERKGSLTKT